MFPTTPRWLLLPQELLEQWADKGGDLHTKAAAWAFDVPVEQVTPKQRQEAKAMLFGRLSLQQACGGKKLAEYALAAGCEDAPEQLKARLAERYPHLVEYFKKEPHVTE